MSREDGSCRTPPFRLLEDFSIGGYTHPNESAWALIKGTLHFKRSDGVLTTRFSETDMVDGLAVLRGPFLLDESPGIIHLLQEYPRFENGALIYKPDNVKSLSLTRLALASFIHQYGWSIGDHSYGLPQVMEAGMAKLNIGRFVSIGPDVSIALGNHKTSSVTTYPFSSLRHLWLACPDVADHDTRGDVNIGSDVWIGAGVFIGSGVTIGNGAVIGAHAVITSDVPAYAIAAGVPGRTIRYRFSPEIISEMERIRWWDWPDAYIDAHVSRLVDSGVEEFVAWRRTIG